MPCSVWGGGGDAGVYQSEMINSEGKPEKEEGRVGKRCRLWMRFQNAESIRRTRLKTGAAESTEFDL